MLQRTHITTLRSTQKRHLDIQSTLTHTSLQLATVSLQHISHSVAPEANWGIGMVCFPSPLFASQGRINHSGAPY